MTTAQQRIVETHAPRLGHSLIRRYPTIDAEDAVQEAWVMGLRIIARYEAQPLPDEEFTRLYLFSASRELRDWARLQLGGGTLTTYTGSEKTRVRMVSDCVLEYLPHDERCPEGAAALKDLRTKIRERLAPGGYEDDIAITAALRVLLDDYRPREAADHDRVEVRKVYERVEYLKIRARKDQKMRALATELREHRG